MADPALRLAHVDYGGDVTAVIGTGTMLGMQFHPEKSQDAGLRVLSTFARDIVGLGASCHPVMT